MPKLLYVFPVLIVSFAVFAQGNGYRTKDKMYEKISATTACYRRLNATHQIGCSSKRGGSTGVIHYCQDLDDLNFILNNGTSPPYIPVLPTIYFSNEALSAMINSQKISGVILHSLNESLPSFTHEHECPNPYSSLNGTCSKKPWNPYGTGILYKNIPFPMFYVESELEIAKMKNCFQKFNNFSYDSQSDRSLCSLELNAFMYATTNTPTCRRRSNVATNLNPQKFCDPLGDSNIWATLHPLVENVDSTKKTKPLKGYKYVVIAARLDTTSLFEKSAGANSPVTGIVTLLTVAKYLKEILTVEKVVKAKTNVLFVLFNGETYDYIGSQRMLYDMLKSDFPVEGLGIKNNILPVIKPEDIKLYVELSQLGNSQNNKIYVHYLKEQELISKFSNLLTLSAPKNDKISFTNVSNSVPPSSLHTFLKHDENFAGLILTDHQQSYHNHYYNSIYDNSSNIQYVYQNVSSDNAKPSTSGSIQHFVADVAMVVGKSVYQTVTGEAYPESKDLQILVDELFHCYLENPNCKVYEGTHGKKMPPIPLSLYVGVDMVEAHSTALTAAILRWFTGDIVGDGDSNCTNVPRNYAFKFYNMSQSLSEMNVTKCFRVTSNKTDAVSPAFRIPNYDWSSGQYSTWSESTWAEMTARMFLKPSAVHERTTLAVGFISVVLSFILVYFIKSRSHILFSESMHVEAPTDC